MGIGGILGGVGAIAGAGAGYFGAQAANAANRKMQRQEHKHQSRQAVRARTLTRNLAKKTRIFNRQESGKSRRASSREAVKSRKWMKKMSNTEMRRRTRDLKKAGLNPILAAGGPGATSQSSTPAAQSAASAGAPGAPGISTAGMIPAINELESGVNSAVAMGQAFSRIKLMDREDEILKQEGKKRKWEAVGAEFMSNSAKSRSIIDKEAASGTEHYGTHPTGQFFRSMERMLTRAYEGGMGYFFDEKKPLDIYPGPIHQPQGLRPDEMGPASPYY